MIKIYIKKLPDMEYRVRIQFIAGAVLFIFGIYLFIPSLSLDDFTKTIVAAVIGGLMVMTGQFIQDRRKSIEDKKKIKADKIEDLVITIWQYYDAFLDSAGIKGTDRATMISFHFKIHSIITVHFPQFETRCFKMTRAGLIYIKESPDSETVAGLKKDFSHEFHAFLREVTEYAKRELQ